jgi:hypothetical protein
MGLPARVAAHVNFPVLRGAEQQEAVSRLTKKSSYRFHLETQKGIDGRFDERSSGQMFEQSALGEESARRMPERKKKPFHLQRERTQRPPTVSDWSTPQPSIKKSFLEQTLQLLRRI